MNTEKIMELFHGSMTVVNIGPKLFATALQEQNCPTVQVDWQPVAGGDESNPRITWGKYEETTSGRVVMPVSILAHHALVDGVQLAGFYENLGRELQMYRGYL